MATGVRSKVGEVLRQRRKELGLTLGQVAQALGTSDGYVWKLEQGLINLGNVPYHRLVALMKVFRWSPEEFAQATGVKVPGFTAEGVPGAPPVPLLKVPLVGAGAGAEAPASAEEPVEYLILGFPGVEVDPKDLRALAYKDGFVVYREGEEPEHGKLAVAVSKEGQKVRYPVRFLGLNTRKSFVVETLECPSETQVLEKTEWELHRVVGQVRLED